MNIMKMVHKQINNVSNYVKINDNVLEIISRPKQLISLNFPVKLKNGNIELMVISLIFEIKKILNHKYHNINILEEYLTYKV